METSGEGAAPATPVLEVEGGRVDFDDVHFVIAEQMGIERANRERQDDPFEEDPTLLGVKPYETRAAVLALAESWTGGRERLPEKERPSRKTRWDRIEEPERQSGYEEAVALFPDLAQGATFENGGHQGQRAKQ